RPDLVKQVINKIKIDGLVDTYKAVMSRLDSPVTLGYSSAGTVLEAGEGMGDIKAGDRIACFGDGFATHSELSFVPKNMLTKIPEGVSFEEAAFVGVGSIALNAIRLARLTFGEKVAVIGLGLLGQLSVQMLKAFGCKVTGIDIDAEKAELAKRLGADETAVIGKNDLSQLASRFDAVLIMAGANSNAPIEMAAEISRDQGRIVACGMIKLDVPRQEFFKKELKVIVSRATGPGKFDPLYENKGIDYPLPYVRWTTQRNMEYFLELIAQKKVNVKKLITHRVKIDEVLGVYDILLNGKESYMGVVIGYKGQEDKQSVETITIEGVTKKPAGVKQISLGLVGAGLHASTSMLPALKKISQFRLAGIADAQAFKAQHAGEKYGFEYCAADYQKLLEDKSIDAIFIATRHNLHAEMVINSLKAGKHVFVEKPLAMNAEELKRVENAYRASNKQLMVGFNRRFAPHTIMAKQLLGNASDLVINCRVNAGLVPDESWVHDSQEGGGRVVGEVCHFIDLLQALTGALPVQVFAESTQKNGRDNLIINLKFDNGSVASILYASQGDRLLPRERVEVFSGNSVYVIDNFKSLFFAKEGNARKKSLLSLDRGYSGEFEAFLYSIRTGKPVVDFKEYLYTTLASFAVLRSIQLSCPVPVQQG
ncbi:MAG: bi-domain-containing oxidoreductase, partial [Candidatus Margulisbacteria bacterium]|nr:bi-domain-containing oxidoreductase [Candidatus Margulisiibacteriota bacterium]